MLAYILFRIIRQLEENVRVQTSTLLKLNSLGSIDEVISPKGTARFPKIVHNRIDEYIINSLYVHTKLFFNCSYSTLLIRNWILLPLINRHVRDIHYHECNIFSKILSLFIFLLLEFMLAFSLRSFEECMMTIH